MIPRIHSPSSMAFGRFVRSLSKLPRHTQTRFHSHVTISTKHPETGHAPHRWHRSPSQICLKMLLTQPAVGTFMDQKNDRLLRSEIILFGSSFLAESAKFQDIRTHLFLEVKPHLEMGENPSRLRVFMPKLRICQSLNSFGI